jgi:hypothetical protein
LCKWSHATRAVTRACGAGVRRGCHGNAFTSMFVHAYRQVVPHAHALSATRHERHIFARSDIRFTHNPLRTRTLQRCACKQQQHRPPHYFFVTDLHTYVHTHSTRCLSHTHSLCAWPRLQTTTMTCARYTFHTADGIEYARVKHNTDSASHGGPLKSLFHIGAAQVAPPPPSLTRTHTHTYIQTPTPTP